MITGVSELTDAQHTILSNLGHAMLSRGPAVILVINLALSTERREAATRVLDALGVPYEFIVAVTEDEADPRMVALMEGYMPKKAEIPLIERLRANKGSRARRTACSMSHFKAWARARELMDENPELGAVYVLEDDIAIIDDPEAHLLHLRAVEQFYQVPGALSLHMGVSFWPDDVFKNKVQNYTVHSPDLLKLEYAYGSFAVMYTRAGIDFMINVVQREIEKHVAEGLRVQPQDVVIAFHMSLVDGMFAANPSYFGAYPTYSTVCGQYMDYTGQVLVGHKHE